ncbi:MAG: substrate-binding domain-containing protein [Akkermansiaceae bacterium]|nr:substrate-binding domain-containing protein [Akkermansiaceae bacterium]
MLETQDNAVVRNADIRWRVGLLAPQAFHFYSSEVVSGMSSVRLEPGQGVIPVDLLYRRDEDIPELLAAAKLDGMILGLDRGRYDKYRKYLPDIPMVNVHPDNLGPTIPTIAIDPQALARATVRYFKSLGVRNIATVSTVNTEAQKRVLHHIRECMADGGGEFDSFTVGVSGITTSYQNRHELPVVEGLDDWLSRLARPTGILSSGGYTAITVVQAARRLGIGIPDSLSVLSRSDDNVCLFADPPISSFRSVGSVVGKLAIKLLTKHLNGHPLPQDEIGLPAPTVVERYSTGVPQGTESSLAMAVHYIRQNAFKGITVEDVLDASPGLSRSRLYRGFEEQFGNSPAHEILRLRIEEAKYLLRFSGKSLTEISEQCSFKNVAHFSTVFTREEGMSPGKWRKKSV